MVGVEEVEEGGEVFGAVEGAVEGGVAEAEVVKVLGERVFAGDAFLEGLEVGGTQVVGGKGFRSHRIGDEGEFFVK